MRRIFVAIFLVTLVFSGLGCAKHHFASLDEVFILYDVDKNGVITKEEFLSQWKDQKKAAAAWEKVDKERKGSISRAQANDIPLDVWSDLEMDNLH